MRIGDDDVRLGKEGVERAFEEARMTPSTVSKTEFVPHNNPCAQCGKPIASPIWSEPGPRCDAYVWHCDACDYEFTTLAMYATDRAEAERIAA